MNSSTAQTKQASKPKHSSKNIKPNFIYKVENNHLNFISISKTESINHWILKPQKKCLFLLIFNTAFVVKYLSLKQKFNCFWTISEIQFFCKRLFKKKVCFNLVLNSFVFSLSTWGSIWAVQKLCGYYSHCLFYFRQ